MRFFTLLCCFLVAAVASAHEFTVGTVDLQKLFDEYPGTKSAQKKFKDMMDKKKQELMDTAEDLKSEEKSLKDSASVYSKKELKAKEEELMGKEKAFNDEQNQAQTDFSTKAQEMEKTLYVAIKSIVADVAKNKGVDLVLDSDKTVYAKDATDLTADVLKTYKSSDSSDSDK